MVSTGKNSLSRGFCNGFELEGVISSFREEVLPLNAVSTGGTILANPG
jgi:hypothetical protein